MTSERDIERLLDRWFTERPTDVADRVLDEVADRIGRQPQQRAWRVLRRDSHVNSYLKPLLAVAAVVVIAVAGVAFLGQPSDSGVGGAVTPAPSPSPAASTLPSATPSAAPSAGAVLPPWYTTSETPSGPGILSAGGHTTRSFMPGFTFSVPDGWVNDTDSVDFFGLFPDTPANQAQFARSEGLAQSMAMSVYPSPWFTCESVENNRGATAAEMVAAAMANEALAVSDPVDVAIGGLTGKQFDVRRNPDWTGTCPGDSDLPQGLDPRDERTRGIFLDVPDRGVLVMLLYSMSSAETEAFLAEAMPIIESFQFDLGPEASPS